MTRLVLIDRATHTYSVYEGKVCLATYTVTDKDTPPSKEVVEEIRIAEYPNKA